METHVSEPQCWGSSVGGASGWVRGRTELVNLMWVKGVIGNWESDGTELGCGGKRGAADRPGHRVWLCVAPAAN